MELHQFLIEALRPQEGLRRGQAFMNALFLVRPKLYHRIMEDSPDLDVFYSGNEDDLMRTAAWVSRNWDE